MEHCLQKRKVPISLSVVLFWEVDGWQMGGVWWIFVFFFLKNLEVCMAWKSLSLPGCQWQVKGFNERISPSWKNNMSSWCWHCCILAGVSHFKGISQNLHVMRMGGLLLLDDFFGGDFACDLCVLLRAPLTKTPHVCFRVPNPKRHGRFKPRSELGRLEVGGGGIGHPKLVKFGIREAYPQKWRKHAA